MSVHSFGSLSVKMNFRPNANLQFHIYTTTNTQNNGIVPHWLLCDENRACKYFQAARYSTYSGHPKNLRYNKQTCYRLEKPYTHFVMETTYVFPGQPPFRPIMNGILYETAESRRP